MDERWIDFDGVRLFVRSWGDSNGTPLLYWHGVHIAGRASMAINEAGPMAGEHGLRVLALDAPGFEAHRPSSPTTTTRTPWLISSQGCSTRLGSTTRLSSGSPGVATSAATSRLGTPSG